MTISIDRMSEEHKIAQTFWDTDCRPDETYADCLDRARAYLAKQDAFVSDYMSQWTLLGRPPIAMNPPLAAINPRDDAREYDFGG